MGKGKGSSGLTEAAQLEGNVGEAFKVPQMVENYYQHPIRHGCNCNPQQLDKICLSWFHIGWIISCSLFSFRSCLSIHFIVSFIVWGLSQLFTVILYFDLAYQHTFYGTVM